MSSQVKLMSWHYGLGRRQAVSHDEIEAVGDRVLNFEIKEKNVVPALSSAYLILSLGFLPRKLQELTQ